MAIAVVFVTLFLAFTLACNVVAAQVTTSPSVRANATSNGGFNVNVQLPTVPPVSTPSSPSPSPVTIVEQRSGGISPLLSLLSSWLWLLLIVILLLLVIIIIVFLITRPPRYDEYGPEEGYYEETRRVTRRRRRY